MTQTHFKQANKIIIVGAGGQARVVSSILAYYSDFEVVGFLDRVLDSIGEKIGSNTVIGDHSRLPQLLIDGVQHGFIAVGDNKIRAEHFLKLLNMGFQLPNLIHPTSFIEQDVTYGNGNLFAARSVLGTNVQLGNDCIINTGAIIDHETEIGNHVHIAPSVSVAGRVTIENYSFIGIGATVKEYITIGENVTVGAGAVVLADLPDNVVAVGVPARIIREKDYDRCS